jgi:hypothetical protein
MWPKNLKFHTEIDQKLADIDRTTHIKHCHSTISNIAAMRNIEVWVVKLGWVRLSLVRLVYVSLG